MKKAARQCSRRRKYHRNKDKEPTRKPRPSGRGKSPRRRRPSVRGRIAPFRIREAKAGHTDADHDRRDLDPARLEKCASELMADEDVTRKSGAYAYVPDGDERHLSIRAFDKRTQRAAYERQDGRCAVLRAGLRLLRHARRPYHALEQGRAHHARQLPDAVP